MGLFDRQFRIVKRIEFDGEKKFVIQSRRFGTIWWEPWSDERIYLDECVYDSLDEAVEMMKKFKPKLKPKQSVIKIFK